MLGLVAIQLAYSTVKFVDTLLYRDETQRWREREEEHTFTVLLTNGMLFFLDGACDVIVLCGAFVFQVRTCHALLPDLIIKRASTILLEHGNTSDTKTLLERTAWRVCTVWYYVSDGRGR